MKGQVMYGLPGHGKTGFYTLEMGNHWMALFFERSACAFLSGLTVPVCPDGEAALLDPTASCSSALPAPPVLPARESSSAVLSRVPSMF